VRPPATIKATASGVTVSMNAPKTIIAIAPAASRSSFDWRFNEPSVLPWRPTEFPQSAGLLNSSYL